MCNFVVEQSLVNWSPTSSRSLLSVIEELLLEHQLYRFKLLQDFSRLQVVKACPLGCACLKIFVVTSLNRFFLGPPILPCKAKRQYLLSLQVSRYCLFDSQSKCILHVFCISNTGSTSRWWALPFHLNYFSKLVFSWIFSECSLARKHDELCTAQIYKIFQPLL